MGTQATVTKPTHGSDSADSSAAWATPEQLEADLVSAIRTRAMAAA